MMKSIETQRKGITPASHAFSMALDNSNLDFNWKDKEQESIAGAAPAYGVSQPSKSEPAAG